MDAPLRVVLPDGEAVFSRGGTDSAPTLLIRNPRLFERVPRDGSIGLGESYMASEWDADDLVGVCGALGARVVTAVPGPIRWGRRWREYFERCASMLRPKGRMAMQTITESDRYFRFYGSSMGFINKHIFPGGMLSSVRQLRRTISQSPFRLGESREIGQHYVPTLADWRRRFDANQNRREMLGSGE